MATTTMPAGVNTEEKKVIFASSLGTVFEWYDFYLYAVLAPFFAALFFPPGNQTAALLSAFATYAAGFLVRPFGALVFGRIGDLVGRGTLAADHLGAAALGVVDNNRHIAARTVQMRLDHLQREGGGDAGVEGVAALLQNTHADRSGDPVRRGDDAEGAFDFRAGGERIGIDVPHGRAIPCWYRYAGALDHRCGWMPTAGMPRIAPIFVIIPRLRSQPDG